MPQKNKIKRFPAVTSLVIFLLMGILKVTVPSDNLWQTLVFVLSNITYFGIVFSWGFYVERSILSAKTRRLMLSLVFFMVVYLLTGFAKNGIFLDDSYAGRFLWYLYYIPQIFATFIAFIIAYIVGKPEEYKLPVIFRWLFAVGVVIVVFYLTNDFHQLAFSFKPGFSNWDKDYDWGILFYISTAWIYFFLIAGVIMLSVKSRTVSKKKSWLPVFWLIVGSLYIFSDYIFGLWDLSPFNLPETHCFILIAMLESSIRIDILPSNSAYGEIVSKSSAAFHIADCKNNIIYRSDKAVGLQTEQMDEAKGRRTYVDKNMLLLSNSISGGYVFWTEDMTVVNEMNEQLSQISQSLSEEGDLIRAENELREQRASIAEQTSLYDSISDKVRPQLEIISRLIIDDENFDKNMAHICILNCYVKRRSNLALLKYRKSEFSSEELYLSVKESSEYLKLHGGVSDVISDSHGFLSADSILLCFDLWQSVVEVILPDECNITAKLSFKDEFFIFRIIAETEKSLLCVKNFCEETEKLGAEIGEETEDGMHYITLKIRKGGEE